MGSAHGYATLANIEAFSGIDYSTVDSVAFHDDKVEYKISMAEYIINGHLGVSVAETITNGITMATVMIAVILLDNNMIHLGYEEAGLHSIGNVIGMTIKEILDKFLIESSNKRNIGIKTDVTDNFFSTD